MTLKRIGWIARPGALYYDSVSARTFEDVNRGLEEPIDVEETTGRNITSDDVDISKSNEWAKFPTSKGFLSPLVRIPSIRTMLII